MQTLEQEIAYRGCILEPRIVTPTQELKNLGSLLANTSFSEETPAKRSLREIRRESANFLNNHYELHDVPILIEKKYGPFQFEIQNTISPFRIPIRKENEDDDFFGVLRETISFTEGIRIDYRRIELPKKITEITALSHTHEITHTQLNHMRGIIRNYHNMEILSIFNETVHAKEKEDGERLLRIHDRRRLEELREIIEILQSPEQEPEEILIDASSYCISTLQAYNLFITYYYGDKATREFIMEQIQRVFHGEITLEEVLEEKLKVTFQNSQDSKKLAKYLNR